MTRINVVPVQELSRLHLIAEYRELPRVFRLVERHVLKGRTPKDINIPEQYTLGEGHVKFFYNKLQYCCDRHRELVNEMLDRYYLPKFTGCLADEYPDIPDEWWGEYSPSITAEDINRARIQERSFANV